ncbi:MAG: FAD-binding oxidoreductase [Candidatus Wallbacteria bacterium]|nr:FAD-binding oxidoreductase [Candidatus Wallbacteria bacterium]
MSYLPADFRHGRRRGQAKPDCVVVGAGVVGCSIALALARRGYLPLVVDRAEDCGQGSTKLSTAVIRQRFLHAPAVALALEGLRVWQQWPEFLGVEDPRGMALFREVGVLWLLGGPAPRLPALAHMMETVGAKAELLDAGRLAGRFPQLHIPEEPSTLNGLYEPEGGYVDDPALATHNLRVAAEAAGARFLFGTRVTEVTSRFSAATGVARQVTGVVTSSGSAISAPVVVNAGGPHSGQINLMARSPLALATAPVRQQLLEGPAPGLMHAPTHLPVLADLPGGWYCKPDAHRFRVGSLDPRDELDFQADPDRVDPVVSAAFRKDKLSGAAARLPGAKLRSPRPMVGVYDVTVADWHPILDRTDLDGYFVAVGTSGAWFKGAPVIGHLMAELVEAVRDGFDHDRTPLLVRLPYTRNLLDLGFFSRRRSPIAAAGVLG